MQYLNAILVKRIAILAAGMYAATSGAIAQQSRITRPIDSTQRFTLADHIHPRARADIAPPRSQLTTTDRLCRNRSAWSRPLPEYS